MTALGLKEPLPSFLAQEKKRLVFLDNPPKRRGDLKLFALNIDREIMHKRLKLRIDQMFERGLLEEARDLHENHQLSKTAAAGVGYKELFQFFEGEVGFRDGQRKNPYWHQTTFQTSNDLAPAK